MDILVLRVDLRARVRLVIRVELRVRVSGARWRGGIKGNIRVRVRASYTSIKGSIRVIH